MTVHPDALMESQWWDDVAADPNELHANQFGLPGLWSDWDQPSMDEILPALALAPAGRVLDLGCGIGRLACAVRRALPRVEIIGVDISPRTLANRMCSGFHPLIGNGRVLPDVGPLDGGYSMGLFQHLPDGAWFDYLESIRQHLKSGARFRFQWVEGTDQAYLLHQHNPEWVAALVEAVGLHVVAMDRSAMWGQWMWTTTAKP